MTYNFGTRGFPPAGRSAPGLPSVTPAVAPVAPVSPAGSGFLPRLLSFLPSADWSKMTNGAAPGSATVTAGTAVNGMPSGTLIGRAMCGPMHAYNTSDFIGLVRNTDWSFSVVSFRETSGVVSVLGMGQGFGGAQQDTAVLYRTAVRNEFMLTRKAYTASSPTFSIIRIDDQTGAISTISEEKLVALSGDSSYWGPIVNNQQMSSSYVVYALGSDAFMVAIFSTTPYYYALKFNRVTGALTLSSVVAWSSSYNTAQTGGFAVVNEDMDYVALVHGANVNPSTNQINMNDVSYLKLSDLRDSATFTSRGVDAVGIEYTTGLGFYGASTGYNRLFLPWLMPCGEGTAGFTISHNSTTPTETPAGYGSMSYQNSTYQSHYMDSTGVFLNLQSAGYQGGTTNYPVLQENISATACATLLNTGGSTSAALSDQVNNYAMTSVSTTCNSPAIGIHVINPKTLAVTGYAVTLNAQFGTAYFSSMNMCNLGDRIVVFNTNYYYPQAGNVTKACVVYPK